MGRKKLGRKRLDVTLPPDVIEWLARAAEARHSDRSRIVEEALRAMMAKGERQQQKGGVNER